MEAGYDKIKEKYEDSLSQYDLKKSLEDPDLGKLNFSEIIDDYRKIVEDLLFLESEDYRENLYQQDVTSIDQIRQKFIANFTKLVEYDPETHNVDHRKNLITEFNQLKDSHEKNIHDFVTKIKLENLLASPEAASAIDQLSGDLSQLKDEITEASKIKKELESKLKELNKIKPATEQVASQAGGRQISTHFSSQAQMHEIKAEGEINIENKVIWPSKLFGNRTKLGWLQVRKMYEVALFFTVFSFLGLFVASIFYFSQETYEKIWSVRSAALFAALIAIEYSGYYFATRSYRQEKEMQYSNQGKANVAETLLLLTARESEQVRGLIMLEGAKSLFSGSSGSGRQEDALGVNLSTGDIVANKTHEN